MLDASRSLPYRLFDKGHDGRSKWLMECAGHEAMAPWRGFNLSGHQLAEEMQAFADARYNVYLFELNRNHLTYRCKDPGTGPVAPDPWHRNALNHRASIYLGLLRQVIALFGISGQASFLINMDDIFEPFPSLPVFVFQRPRGSRNLLLPDVELIADNFYIEDNVQDYISIEHKDNRAVFVGSNTGRKTEPWNNEDEIINERIRAALAFRGVAEVDFFLPSIVQNDPMLVKAMERAGILGRRLSWSEQFNYRFLLSMDGHGAACSRLEIALRSNAVPVKFESSHELYFFSEMKPWREYIPATSPEDILPIISLWEKERSTIVDVAHRSQKFFQTNLSRLAVYRYTASIINAYIDRFGRELVAPQDDGFAIDGYAHFAGLGSRWSTPNDWIQGPGDQAIEGFVLEPGLPLRASDLRYVSIDAAGQRGVEKHGFDFCGTRGASTPLYGLSISLMKERADQRVLHYAARFADGAETEMVPSGTPLFSKAPLIGFRLIFA